METRGGEYFHPIPFDLKNLAATIALASDALAAAAEALAEAASAIGDATNTFQDSTLPKVSSGIIHPVDTPQKLGDRDEPGIGNGFLGVRPHPADQPGLTGDPSQSRLEHGIPNKISSESVLSISSDSTSEVEVVPLDPPLEPGILGNESPEHVTDNDSLDSPEPEPEPEPETELNNKLDTLPQSPVALTSNEPNIDINWAIVDGASSLNGSQTRISNLLQSAESYPALPMGRNFIHLEHVSDGFAFIAYMGLQFRKIVCLIPDQLMNVCSSLLRSFANANVYRVHSFSQFRSLSVALGAMTKPNSFNIMLVPPIFMNLLSSSHITPDCVLHWGQPPSSDRWVKNVLAFISPAVRVCMIIVGTDTFNGRAHGVASYPHSALASLHDLGLPFQQLRQVYSQHFPGPNASAITESHNPQLRPNPLGAISPAPGRSDPGLGTHVSAFPAGHYYVLLDGADNTDIILLIAYIAMHSKRMICLIPNGEDIYTFEKLIKLIANINIITPAPQKKTRKGKAIIRQLKSSKRGVLLREGGRGWNARISKSVVDCLIYCGNPQDIQNYLAECRMKVERSYLVLNKGRDSADLSYLTERGIWQHPHIRADDITRPGTELYDLRQKLTPYAS